MTAISHRPMCKIFRVDISFCFRQVRGTNFLMQGDITPEGSMIITQAVRTDDFR